MYAEKTTEQVLDSLQKYFNHIEQTGYMRYDTVAGLLGLMLVDSFLNTDLNTFVTEEDYDIMSRFLYCIYGNNCLVPYPVFIKETPRMGAILPSIGSIHSYRNTQDESIRIDNGSFRITENDNSHYWNN